MGKRYTQLTTVRLTVSIIICLATTAINNDWENLVDHFDFLRNRESQHQVLTSQILRRVMGWTLFEAGLVICMALGQVMYWKKFFEQRRYL